MAHTKEQKNLEALIATVDELAENINEYIELIPDEMAEDAYGAAMLAARAKMVRARRHLLQIKKDPAVKVYLSER